MKRTRRGAAASMRAVQVRRDMFRLTIDELTLYPGEVHCVVGPNGCGKSTLLYTMLGLLPYSGSCMIQGKLYDGTDPRIKAQIGFVPDDPELLFEELTAREQWAVTASVLADVQPQHNEAELRHYAAGLAERIGFDPPAATLHSYSHGMRKKTQIVDALIGRPSLVVLDELHNGLDPLAIGQVEALLQSEVDRGVAILAATHDLWWAERFADYIYVMHRGQICAAGTPQQLRTKSEPTLMAAFQRIVGAVS